MLSKLSLGLSIGLRRRRGVPYVTRGGIVLFTFDEGEGQIVTDHSPNGYHGQLGSTAGVDANDPSWIAAGLSVPATDDYVLVPSGGTSRFKPGGAFSIVWAGMVGNNSGIKTLANVNVTAWGFQRANGTQTLQLLHDGAVRAANNFFTSAAAERVVAGVTVGTSQVQFYKNGQPFGAPISHSTTIAASTADLYLGRTSSSNAGGEFHHFSLHGVALTAEEHAQQYAAFAQVAAARGITY